MQVFRSGRATDREIFHDFSIIHSRFARFEGIAGNGRLRNRTVADCRVVVRIFESRAIRRRSHGALAYRIFDAGSCRVFNFCCTVGQFFFRLVHQVLGIVGNRSLFCRIGDIRASLTYAGAGSSIACADSRIDKSIVGIFQDIDDAAADQFFRRSRCRLNRSIVLGIAGFDQLFRFIHGVVGIVGLGPVGDGGGKALCILVHNSGIGAVRYGGSDLICFLQVVGCIGSVRNVGIGLAGNRVDGGLLVTIIQLVLANVLPLIFDSVTATLPAFLQGIFAPNTIFDAATAKGVEQIGKYVVGGVIENGTVIGGVVTWGYLLPFFLSNLVANIYGFYQNKKTTFKSDAPWYNFAIYIFLMIALILFSTWFQGWLVGVIGRSSWGWLQALARTIASLAAGFVQMVVLFPMEKFIQFFTLTIYSLPTLKAVPGI